MAIGARHGNDQVGAGLEPRQRDHDGKSASAVRADRLAVYQLALPLGREQVEAQGKLAVGRERGSLETHLTAGGIGVAAGPVGPEGIYALRSWSGADGQRADDGLRRGAKLEQRFDGLAGPPDLPSPGADWHARRQPDGDGRHCQAVDLPRQADKGANAGEQESFSHTAAGSDRVALLHLAGIRAVVGGFGFNFGTPQYGGVNMTQLESYAWTSVSTNRAMVLELWALEDPATGAQNVTFTPSTWLSSYGAICTTYTGVGAVGNSAIANGTSTTPSVSVTTQVANTVLAGGACNQEGSAHTPGTSQTERADDNYDGANASDRIYFAAGDEAHASAASHTHDWTITSAPWICAAVELQPATATAGFPEADHHYRTRRL